MNLLSAETQDLIAKSKAHLDQTDPEASRSLVATIEFLDAYAHDLEKALNDTVQNGAENASAEISVGPLKVVCTLSDNRLSCRAYVLGIFVEEYFLERNGGRIITKIPSGPGYADIEFWWENENLHAKARACVSKPIIGAVCTGWASGSVRIPGA